MSVMAGRGDRMVAEVAMDYLYTEVVNQITRSYSTEGADGAAPDDADRELTWRKLEELGFKVAGEAAAAAPGARARRELVGDFDGAARPRRARSSVDMRGPSNKAPTQLANRDR